MIIINQIFLTPPRNLRYEQIQQHLISLSTATRSTAQYFYI